MSPLSKILSKSLSSSLLLLSGVLTTLLAPQLLMAQGRWVPDLPETLDNYSNVTLPNHFLVNGFPGNARQNAVIDNDNTPAGNPVTDAGATLGRVLFYDRKLSANETVSCASCHQQSHGFSDPDRLSIGFEGGETRRHSMGLANARFYESGKFFWDERAATLEDQVLQPIQDHVEMGLTLAELVSVVEREDYYGPLFIDAFGDPEVTTDRISRALAQFVRSILSFTAKYDEGRALVNSPLDPFPNFTPQENAGKNLFMRPIPGTQASCVACHMGEAFISPASFNSPPNATTNATNNGLQAASTDDFGVLEATMNMADDFKFKVPSLRNISARPPYMHDGRFATLQQVIGFYSNGIQNHDNLSPILRNPNGTPVRFNFNQRQRGEMLAFLNTLTDDAMMTDPKFSDPFVFVEPGPEVLCAMINMGQSQRSVITDICVIFDQEIDLASDAVKLIDRATEIEINAADIDHIVVPGMSIVIITFTDGEGARPRSSGNSLNDGNYQLSIAASGTSAVDNGPSMESDYVYGDLAEHAFFCLFGDTDGDRDVDGQDYGRFGSAFLSSAGSPSFDTALDYDGDGDIDGQDYGQFGLRFLTGLRFE